MFHLQFEPPNPNPNPNPTLTSDTYKDNMILQITQREQDRVDAEKQTKTLKVQVENLSKSFEVREGVG